MKCCRRCGATWKTWCASNRCGPTRTAAAKCNAAPKRWQSCCPRPASVTCRSCARAAPLPSSPDTRPRPEHRPCCCTPTTTCSPKAITGSWVSPPFEPTERNGRLFGRGTADDKAGIATHLAAFRAHGGRPPVGVTVFVEGEEESGSPSLDRLLATHRDTLSADVIVIADSDNWSTERPALTVSLRGLADCVVEVATSTMACTGPVGRGGARRAERAGAPAGQPARRRGQRRGRRPVRRDGQPARCRLPAAAGARGVRTARRRP